MMSDFFESFLTPPTPLNPIFTFYNPIFWGHFRPPPPLKSDIIYVRSLRANERMSLLLLVLAGGSACGLGMGSRPGRQAGRKRGTFICGFSGMMVSLPVDIDSP